MNKKHLSILLVPGFILATSLPTLAASSSSSSQQATKIGVGLHSHADYSAKGSFASVLYTNNAWSYGLAYEYQDGASYWQIAVDYCTGDFSGTDATVDYTLSPQLNLMVTDSFWRGGLGIATSYKKKHTGSDWTDMYWQFIAGVSVPLGRIQIDILAFYPFDKWDALSDFDIDGIGYGGWIKYSF